MCNSWAFFFDKRVRCDRFILFVVHGSNLKLVYIFVGWTCIKEYGFFFIKWKVKRRLRRSRISSGLNDLQNFATVQFYSNQDTHNLPTQRTPQYWTCILSQWKKQFGDLPSKTQTFAIGFDLFTQYPDDFNHTTGDLRLKNNTEPTSPEQKYLNTTRVSQCWHLHFALAGTTHLSMSQTVPKRCSHGIQPNHLALINKINI